MGLKEELAGIKKTKLTAELPQAQDVPRQARAKKTEAKTIPQSTSPAPQQALTQMKTITAIAEEVQRELSLSKAGVKPSPPIVDDSNVLRPLPATRLEKEAEKAPEREEDAQHLKTITAIAEEIAAEKNVGAEEQRPKSIDELMQQGTLLEGGQASGGQKTSGKSIPAIAEEIRKEMGAEQKQESTRAEAQLPEPPAPPYATTPIPSEMIDRIAEAKEKASTPEPKRLYLLKPDERQAPAAQERPERAGGYSPHRRIYEEGHGNAGRAPVEGEAPGFEEMVSEVYVQVKGEQEREKPVIEEERREEREGEKRRREEEARRQFEERRRQRDARKHSQEPKKEEPSAVPQSVSIEELLGEKPGHEAKASGLFGELEKAASSGGGGNLFGELEEASKSAAAKKQAEFTVVAKEKGCPNCKNAATKIVYCPYCGGAMCANCATKITPYPDHFTYVCPHCSEEVEVKKKAV